MRKSLLFISLSILSLSFYSINTYALTWKGGNGTNATQKSDWTRAGNWVENVVPTATDNVVIPSGPAFMPQLSSPNSAYCKNLTVNAGATWTYNNMTTGTPSGGLMNIYGNIVCNGYINHPGNSATNLFSANGTISGSGTYYEFGIRIKTGAKYTPLNTINYLYSLRIEDGGQFYVSNQLIYISNYIELNVTGSGGNTAPLYLQTGEIRYRGSSVPDMKSNFYCGTGMFWYNSSTSNQIVYSCNYYNLKLNNNTSRSANIGGGGDVTVLNNFDILDAGNCTTGYAFLSGNLKVSGNMSIASACKLDAYNQSGTLTKSNVFNIELLSNLTNNGNFVPRSSTVTFDGSINQSINGNSTTNFFNLLINNGNKLLTLNADAGAGYNDGTISASGIGSLNMSGGNLILNKHQFTIWENSSAGINRSSGMIISEDNSLNGSGKANNASKICWKIGSNTQKHIYPFGLSTGEYIPFEAQNTTNILGDLTVSTYHTGTSGLSDTLYPLPSTVGHLKNAVGSNNSGYMAHRFWQIDRTNGTGTPSVNVKFTYVASGSLDERAISTAGGGREIGYRAQRFDGTANKWNDTLPAQVHDIINHTVAVVGITQFSPWALSKAVSPLPITLINFSANKQNEKAILNWRTASELGFDHFEIEKRINDEFKAIGTVAGKGFSNTMQLYSFTDPLASQGWNTYRLKMVDNNGTESFSSIATILFEKIKPTITVFPNPCAEYVYVKADLILEIFLSDNLGRKINIPINGNSLDLHTLTNGLYFVNCKYDTNKETITIPIIKY